MRPTTSAARVLPRIAPAGDAGFYVRFGDEISPALFDRVMAALAAVDGARLSGVVDVLPGYASLLVLFDPALADPERVRAGLALALAGVDGAVSPPPRRWELPVFYDPSVAPDLLPLAQEKGLSMDALVARHTAPEYRCHMLGFRPGFPFLGGLDPSLAAPRLPTPRLSVAAGSVGIGGRQTGVYPGPGPGGWRIVGRTPLPLFDAARASPFLFQPGDLVRFVPIGRDRFEDLGRSASAWPVPS